nr:apoptosis inhibitor 5-like protein API5 isoform X1 [Coffea arabica]
MTENSDEAKDIDELYEYGARLNEAKDKTQHVEDYENIIKAATSTSIKARQLAAQLIPRFFKFFPSLSVSAVDAHLDLCEAEELGDYLAKRSGKLYCLLHN